jgi:hypothetical protein
MAHADCDSITSSTASRKVSKGIGSFSALQNMSEKEGMAASPAPRASRKALAFGRVDTVRIWLTVAVGK